MLSTALRRASSGATTVTVTVVRAILAESSIETSGAAVGRETLRNMYGAIVRYITLQMDAARLRRMDPTVAAISLIGPVLAYTLTRPDLWFGGGNTPDPLDTVAELVQTWLRGMEP